MSVIHTSHAIKSPKDREIEHGSPMKEGDLVRCWRCKENHPVELTLDKEGRKTDAVMFYTCHARGKVMKDLCGVRGRSVMA